MNFLVSCISTNHSMLKKHWQQSSQQLQCPLTVLGSYQKPQEDQGGLLCLLDEAGQAQKAAVLSMPAGMAPSPNGVFVATPFAIHEVSADLSTFQSDVVSLPGFNLLHSFTHTQRGYVVASTGVDAILEFTHAGDLLWSWWATEQGFTHTPAGKLRQLDTNADHRNTKYGTLAQTTHVNSAAELPDGRILASLFHQGMIISIDRDSGRWQPVLEGLDHPHSVRVLTEDYITVADTGRGRALVVRLRHGRGSIETGVIAETSWLQDCHYDSQNNRWVLVDGKHSRIILRRGLSGDKTLAEFQLDPEWRLYEVLSL